MKTSTLLLILAASAVGGALVARYVFGSSSPHAPLPKCPGDRYTTDPSSPSGWRCSDFDDAIGDKLTARTTTAWSY